MTTSTITRRSPSSGIARLRLRLRLRLMLLGPIVVAALAMMLPVPNAHAGSFRVGCTFSHRNHGDPIVDPGEPDAAHLHDFFGAVTTEANSTYATMVASRSTCTDKQDTAGYWHPHLTADGQSKTAQTTAWYSRGGKATVMPFPRGIKLLAGNMMATAPQSRRIVWWHCSGPGARVAVRLLRPPTCSQRQQVTAELAFPDCWNGRDLDSPDHRAHMKYSRAGACPTTHPYPLPRLVFEMRWPTHVRAAKLAFSSGSWQTIHGDFWNTWNQRRLRSLVDQCLNIDDDCGVVHHRA
ncbi:MAG: DUF1996 domain-containing protein [Thermoleophilia bacterium]|nr:DUF1996 domain-containing protein [Thermoleophilia bacterium]